MAESSFTSNVASNLVRFLTFSIVSFFLSPFLVHRLGAADYGLWSMTLSAAGYFSLLDFGINAGIVVFVARDSASGDRHALERTIGTGRLFLLCVAGTIVVLTLIATALLPALSSLGPEDAGKAQACVFLAGLDLAATFAFAVWNASLVGLQRFVALNAWSLSLWLAKVAVLVLLVRAGFGVRTVALLSVVETATRGVGLSLLVRRFLPGVNPTLASGDRGVFRGIAYYGLYAFVIAASIKAISYTDVLVAGFFMSRVDAARYDIGSKLVNPFYDLFWAAAMVLTPLSARLQARGDPEALKRLHLRGTKCAILLSLPLGFFFLAIGQDFLRRWMGEPFVEPSYPVLATLGLSQVLAIAQQPSVAILKGIGRVRVLALLYAAEAIVNVILSIALVRSYGLVGIAIGTAIPLVDSNGILIPLYACRTLGTSPVLYLREAILPAILPAAPSFLFGMVGVRLLGPFESYPELLGALAGAATLFWLPAAFVTLTREERRALATRAGAVLRAKRFRATAP